MDIYHNAFFAVLLASVALTATSCAKKSPATADTPAAIRVGMECAYAPNNWEESAASDTNAPIMNNAGFFAEGYDVRIARLVCQSLGREMEIVKIPWEGLLEALNRGQIDMIVSGMVDSREHKQAAAFSDTYAIAPTEYGVLVQSDSPFARAARLSDLAGASLLGQRGTKLDSVIDQIQGANHLPPVDSIPNMLDRLNRRTVDGIVINLDSAAAYMKTYPALSVIDFPDGEGFTLDFSGICIALRKTDTALLEQVNAALAKIPHEKRAALMAEVTAMVGEKK